MCGKRIVHVDTGKKIRGSIGPVQKSDHADKNGVLSSDQYRTKQVTVRIDCGHGKEDCHACEEKGAQSVVIAFVLKEEKDNSGSHVTKPQEIGDDEIFAERNIIIHGHMDQMHVTHGLRLQIGKTQYVKYTIYNKRKDVAILPAKPSPCRFLTGCDSLLVQHRFHNNTSDYPEKQFKIYLCIMKKIYRLKLFVKRKITMIYYFSKSDMRR